MTFCFSIILQLPSSHFIHNGILSENQPAPGMPLSCYHVKYGLYAASRCHPSWCFLCYMGLREELFTSQCFIRDLYNTLCHGSINHSMKAHGYRSFYSLLSFDFIYFAWVAPWSWKGLEDMEEQNRLSWNSWSEIASWTQHTQISLGTEGHWQ